jgi:hypothetical protein
VKPDVSLSKENVRHVLEDMESISGRSMIFAIRHHIRFGSVT